MTHNPGQSAIDTDNVLLATGFFQNVFMNNPVYTVMEDLQQAEIQSESDMFI